jgi:hypothetical protein
MRLRVATCLKSASPTVIGADVRKALRIALTFGTLAHCLLNAQVPSVDEVVQHFATALGGKSEFEKIRTMVLRGSLELPDFKAHGTTVEYFKYPDHFVAVSEIFGHGTTKLVCDGHNAWQVDPRHGFTQISGRDLADVIRRAHIHWNLQLRELYPDIHVKSRETIAGEDTWNLEADLEGSTYNFFFSVKTGLLVRFDADQHVTNGSTAVVISDYRPVGKVLFAFGAAQTAGSVKWVRKLNEVKFNDPINDSIFARPSK